MCDARYGGLWQATGVIRPGLASVCRAQHLCALAQTTQRDPHVVRLFVINGNVIHPPAIAP